MYEETPSRRWGQVFSFSPHWVRVWLLSRDSACMTVAAGDPISCFVVKVSMTVVKSVSDGLRDCESETQLNLSRAPQDLTRPQASQPAPGHLSRL